MGKEAVMVAVWRKVLGVCVLLSVAVVGYPVPAGGVWEDPNACWRTMRELNKHKLNLLKEGLAPDSREYTKLWKAANSPLLVEERFFIVPPEQTRRQPAQNQQPGEEVAYLEPAISVWFDWDGNGEFSEWYLDPIGRGNCRDTLHFLWDEATGKYFLTPGQDRS